MATAAALLQDRLHARLLCVREKETLHKWLQLTRLDITGNHSGDPSWKLKFHTHKYISRNVSLIVKQSLRQHLLMGITHSKELRQKLSSAPFVRSSRESGPKQTTRDSPCRFLCFCRLSGHMMIYEKSDRSVSFFRCTRKCFSHINFLGEINIPTVVGRAIVDSNLSALERGWDENEQITQLWWLSWRSFSSVLDYITNGVVMTLKVRKKKKLNYCSARREKCGFSPFKINEERLQWETHNFMSSFHQNCCRKNYFLCTLRLTKKRKTSEMRVKFSNYCLGTL